MAKLRALMIGAGGMAGGWIRHMLPRFSDRMQIVGLCDVVPGVLADAADFLGLPEDARFLRMEDAFARTEADFAIIVIPPAHHRDAVVQAAAHGLHILSEKPIADTWEATCEIYHAVRAAGVKMAVIQNYRYTPRILTLKRVLEEGTIGRPRYVMARFSADYRMRGSWGDFRHRIRHSLLVEGGIHHLDQIRNLAGADCEWIAGMEWNPGHPSFDGESMAQYVCGMRNGVAGNYEGSCLAAAAQHSWHDEYYRVECEDGAVSIGRDQIVRVQRHLGGQRLSTEEVAMARSEYEGHQHVINGTLHWLAGGPAPETRLQDNIQSNAMLFAAIQASEERRTVNVQDKLRQAGCLD